jgi:hypothetical protein
LLEHQNQLRVNFNTLHKKIDPDEAFSPENDKKSTGKTVKLPGIFAHL